jgi:hypothetical protein|tara:strand:+ start:105 stop:923 length:819 start_codon:yes stop_codon:yes gene_type:complete
MATRALIGFLDDSSNEFVGTYNHYDGYPEGLGKTLVKFFNSKDAASKLARTGYISSIDPDNGEIDSKYKEKPYYKLIDTDEAFTAGMMIGDAVDYFGGDYGYIWVEDQWLTLKNNGVEGMAKQIEDELGELGGFMVDENTIKEADASIDYKLDPYEDRDEIEVMIIKSIMKKKGVDEDIVKSFIDTHYEDIIKMGSADEILDEFDEFMSVNTEYVKEEDGKNLNPGNPPANFKSPNEEGDEAVGRESASGAFEEAINWRGETLREQFKRLSK